VDGLSSVDFSTTQNVFFIVKDKLHLVSIDNTVVKNKREKEKKIVDNVQTSK
jgi:hypothetical protein